MSDYLFYCNKCNILIADEYEDDVITCEKCHSNMAPLHITEDQWNELSDEEKLNVLENHDTPHERERRAASSSVRTKTVNLSQVDSVTEDGALFSYEVFVGFAQKGIFSVYKDYFTLSSKKENLTYEFSKIKNIERDKLNNIVIKIKSGRTLSLASSDKQVNPSIEYIKPFITVVDEEFRDFCQQNTLAKSSSSAGTSTGDSSLSNLLKNIDFGSEHPEAEEMSRVPCVNDSDEEFVRKVKNLPHADTMFGKRDIKDLKKILQSGEVVKAVCTGWYEDKTWIFACTDRRVLAVNKNLLIGGDQIEIPFSQIHAMSIKRGLVLSDVTVQTGVRVHCIKNITNDGAKYFVDQANREIEKREQRDSAPSQVINQVAASSDADELRKFKALLDDGIITQEEFDAKKRQILGL